MNPHTAQSELLNPRPGIDPVIKPVIKTRHQFDTLVVPPDYCLHIWQHVVRCWYPRSAETFQFPLVLPLTGDLCAPSHPFSFSFSLQIGFHLNSSASSFLLVSVQLYPSDLIVVHSWYVAFSFFFLIRSCMLPTLHRVHFPTPRVRWLTPTLKRCLPLLSGACTTNATSPRASINAIFRMDFVLAC